MEQLLGSHMLSVVGKATAVSWDTEAPRTADSGRSQIPRAFCPVLPAAEWFWQPPLWILRGTRWREARVNIPRQGKWGGCVRVTGTDWNPSLGSNNSATGVWFFLQLSRKPWGFKNPEPSVVNGGCTPSTGRHGHPWKAQPTGPGLPFSAGIQQGQHSTEMGAHTLESTEPPKSAYTQQQGAERSK